MRPTLNRNLMTFFDLYEFYDQDSTDNRRAGFKQQWELSPFYDTRIPEHQVEGTYNRLLARYFTTPFGMLDERQVHLNVFRIVRDFLPNLIRRIETLDEIYAQNVQDLQMKQSRTGQNQSSGSGNVADTGFENQVQAPNTAASAVAPIIDALSAQRNHNVSRANTTEHSGNTNETVIGDLSTAYQVKLEAIVDGLWDDFIKRFDKLFVHLYNGVYDYIYRNPLDGSEEEEGGQ